MSINLSGGPGAILGKGGNFELNRMALQLHAGSELQWLLCSPDRDSDGLNTVQRTITFDVTPVPDPPVLGDDTINFTYVMSDLAGKKGFFLSELTTNDRDPDGRFNDPTLDLDLASFTQQGWVD